MEIVGKPRREDPNGGVYHLYARGNDGCLIFRDVADRELYLRLLGEVAERAGWRIVAYCLMGNHVHLVVETGEGNLGWGMQILHGRFARAFNVRHGRRGHLFQGRYGSTVIEDDGHMCMTLRYVELNPVNAGLCSRPEEWPWSSCRAIATDAAAPRFLDVERALQSFEWLGGDAAKRYAEMIEPASVGPAALDEAPGQGDRRELVGDESGEEPRLGLGDQSGELLPLRSGQVSAAPPADTHELQQPPPLARIEPGEVVVSDHGDLRDRQQLEDRKPP